MSGFCCRCSLQAAMPPYVRKQLQAGKARQASKPVFEQESHMWLASCDVITFMDG